MDLLSPRDAGKLLGVSTERVTQLNRGLLHAIRDSAGRRLFLRPDVLRLKAKRERAKAATSETASTTP